MDHQKTLYTFLKVAPIAETTKALYEHFLGDFFESLGDSDPATANAITVINWMSTHPSWSSSTRNNAVAAIKAFYRWKYSPDHPATQVKVRKITAPPQRTLSRGELARLIESIDPTTPTGLRDLSIVSLMVDTGMRASEICSLELRYLDLDTGSLSVLGKGGRWQDKVFCEETACRVEAWLEIRPTIASERIKTVFVSVGGRDAGTSLTRHGLFTLFRRLGRRAEIKEFSPHSLRRTFATIAIENGAPTRLVQIAGGWASVTMVERYTRSLKPDAIRAYSPIGKPKPE